MQNIIIGGKYKMPSIWFKPNTWFKYAVASVNLSKKNVITIHENKKWFKKNILSIGTMVLVINHETLHCILDNMGLIQESYDLDKIYVNWRNTQTDSFYKQLM